MLNCVGVFHKRSTKKHNVFLCVYRVGTEKSPGACILPKPMTQRPLFLSLPFFTPLPFKAEFLDKTGNVFDFYFAVS